MEAKEQEQLVALAHEVGEQAAESRTYIPFTWVVRAGDTFPVFRDEAHTESVPATVVGRWADTPHAAIQFEDGSVFKLEHSRFEQ